MLDYRPVLMGRRADKRRIEFLGEHVAFLFETRLRSDEIQGLRRMAGLAEMSPNEFLEKFWKSQYGMVRTETYQLISNMRAANKLLDTFTFHELSFMRHGFLAGVGAVYGTDVARVALEHISRPRTAGALIKETLATFQEPPFFLGTDVRARAHEHLLLVVDEEEQVIAAAEWDTLHSYYLDEQSAPSIKVPMGNPGNLLLDLEWLGYLTSRGLTRL